MACFLPLQQDETAFSASNSQDLSWYCNHQQVITRSTRLIRAICWDSCLLNQGMCKCYIAKHPALRMAVGLCLHGQPCPTASRSPVGRLENVQRALPCCRHVSFAKFTRQHQPKRSASCTTRCLQNSTVELEDIDPLTGAVLTPVRSKVPKYERLQ